MPKLETVKPKTLKQACWLRSLTVTALCARLGISRNTAYEAWACPQEYPKAWPAMAAELGLTHGDKN